MRALARREVPVDGQSKGVAKRRLFKAYSDSGKPLCQGCGTNPRNPQRAKCGRCEREGRAIQWHRANVVARAQLGMLGLSEPPY